jgi:hypothetical protein
MPATALSRAAARVVESDTDGSHLDDQVWARLEALPDPRSPQGRIYPLASLVAVALCGLTVAGHDRLTGIGQWVKRAGPAERKRLGLPWDPMTGQYRVPDEKTVRTVLDRLNPRALTRALLGRRRNRVRPDGAPSRAVRDYRARRKKQTAKALARKRIRAVAVDGKTSRGARRADGTRVHLLGVVEHGGNLLDHLEIDVKHNETSHFTELLDPMDLQDAAVTFDALHTVRANLDWLVTSKHAHYVAVVEHASHCSCCLSWRVEQSSLVVFDLDTEAFAASLGDVDGVEFAALDLVQHGLAGDAEVGCCFGEGEPLVGGVGLDPVA